MLGGQPAENLDKRGKRFNNSRRTHGQRNNPRCAQTNPVLSRSCDGYSVWGAATNRSIHGLSLFHYCPLGDTDHKRGRSVGWICTSRSIRTAKPRATLSIPHPQCGWSGSGAASPGGTFSEGTQAIDEVSSQTRSDRDFLRNGKCFTCK